MEDLMKKLMLVLVLAAVSGAGQTPDAQKTQGRLNGRYWESLAGPVKVEFVVGYAEGVTNTQVSLLLVGIGFANRKLDDEGAKNLRDTIQLLFPLDTSYGDVLKGLDRLYAEPENLPLPINSAFRILAMKFRNDKSEDIDAELRRLRALAIK
jgi:hypothetical protein